MNVTSLIALWSVLFAALVAVYLLRWSVGLKEDDHLHVMDTDKHLVGVQENIAHKLDVLDRWRRILLIATVLLALVIAALHMYATFTRNTIVSY
jgi:hypothetical protein